MMGGTEVLKVEFFDKANSRFTLLDKDFNIIDISDEILLDYHQKRVDLIGKNIFDISPDLKESGLFEKYKTVIRTGQSITFEDFNTHPKFGNKSFKICVFKVGEGIGITSSNITVYRKSIEALELFRNKSSHDMRGPINNIAGISELALEDLSLEKSETYFKMIHQQAKSLSDFLDELIETIRTPHLEFHISIINFLKSIADVKKSLAYVDGYADIVFDEQIEEIFDFSFDQPLITSIFQNLIENAIKYRNQSGLSSKIKISLIIEENKAIKISIADNGIGIPKKDQINIFKMFFRATNQSKGSGLGLYNLHFGIEKLGGHILFESEENVGSNFMVFLPNKG